MVGLRNHVSQCLDMLFCEVSIGRQPREFVIRISEGVDVREIYGSHSNDQPVMGPPNFLLRAVLIFSITPDPLGLRGPVILLYLCFCKCPMQCAPSQPLRFREQGWCVEFRHVRPLVLLPTSRSPVPRVQGSASTSAPHARHLPMCILYCDHEVDASVCENFRDAPETQETHFDHLET